MIVRITTFILTERDAVIEQLEDEKIPYSVWEEYVGDRELELYCVSFPYTGKLL